MRSRRPHAVVRLIEAGHRVVLTHGNGPQVGAPCSPGPNSPPRMPTACRSIAASRATQGEIGYVLQYAMWQAMQQEGLNDPGRVARDAGARRQQRSGIPEPDQADRPVLYAGRRGPLPRSVRLGDRRRSLAGDSGGSSPRPSRRRSSNWKRSARAWTAAWSSSPPAGEVCRCSTTTISPKGVEAVIDKDHTSAILACQLKADVFAIATDVEKVCLDLQETDPAAAGPADGRRMPALSSRTDSFPPGSMGPKITAALIFLERGGRKPSSPISEHLFDAVMDGEVARELTMCPHSDCVGTERSCAVITRR